ncbi:MAG TPA: HAD family hydrolase [Firmicutes bacterium]|nr:HAD family hydrolase [Bacillota bacterium]
MVGTIRYDFVIFDYDGTLADTKEDVWRSLEYACSFFNCRIPPAFRARPSNLALSEAELFAVLCPGVGAEHFAAFCAHLKHHYRVLNDFSRTNLYPGIRDLLGKLREKQTKCYIASLKPAVPLTKLLKQQGIANYFTKWLTPDYRPGATLTKSEMVGSIRKEHPAARGVMVGDSCSDVVAGRENGLVTNGVLYGDGDTERLRCARPDFIVKTAEELIPLLTG